MPVTTECAAALLSFRYPSNVILLWYSVSIQLVSPKTRPQGLLSLLSVFGSFQVSWTLPTYPSPKPTLYITLISHLGQNVGLGEGQVDSFSETYLKRSPLFLVGPPSYRNPESSNWTSETGGGIPYDGFRYMKRWGFHQLRYMKGSRNLSFQCVKKPKLANRCILWLWKSQKSVLFLCVVYSYFKQGHPTRIQFKTT